MKKWVIYVIIIVVLLIGAMYYKAFKYNTMCRGGIPCSVCDLIGRAGIKLTCVVKNNEGYGNYDCLNYTLNSKNIRCPSEDSNSICREVPCGPMYNCHFVFDCKDL